MTERPLAVMGIVSTVIVGTVVFLFFLSEFGYCGALVAAAFWGTRKFRVRHDNSPPQGVLMTALLPPSWLIRLAVASVWLYEGLWCKLLAGEPRQLRIVEAVPFFGPRVGAVFLKTLGAVEVGLAVWSFSHVAPLSCAVAQTLLLVTLNINGLLWARQVIHDPPGMVLKNFAFLVLAWVSASLPGGS